MSALKMNKPKGRLPGLQWAPLELLALDPTYQRSISNRASQRLIRNIAKDWDWNLCLPLVAARRPGQVEFFVVDGQHRLEAAKLRDDIRQLPCVLADYGSPEEEAKSFVQLNQQRRPLNALEIFRAALASGDAQAVHIDQLIRDAGLKLALHAATGQMKPGEISNIGGINRSYRKWGGEIVGQALTVMSTAWEGQRLRFAGTLFGGIANCIGQLKDAGEEVSTELLAMILGETDMADWRGEIALHVAHHPHQKFDAAAAIVIRKSYQESMDDD